MFIELTSNGTEKGDNDKKKFKIYLLDTDNGQAIYNCIRIKLTQNLS
jgi:hypothetical protein